MSLNPLKVVSSGERGIVLAASATLLATTAGHAVLETARDALFLSSIPASELPWVYLLIAVLSFFVSRAVTRGQKAFDPVTLLVCWIFVASAVTAGFFFPLPANDSEWLLYALYIWAGLAATVTLLQFWTLLSSLSTVRDAKRSYAFVGTGAAIGAIVGSGIATAIANIAAPRVLLLIAGGLFSLAAIGPLVLQRMEGDDVEEASPKNEESLRSIVRDVIHRPYVRAIWALVFVATITVTIVDFTFKSVVAANVAAADMALFFAWFYLATNIGSLMIQASVVRALLRRASVTTALLVMPALIVLGSIGFVITATLAMGVLMKGVDGILRHSLQRTAVEVLYVPMRSAVRSRVKAFIDIIGHRGAQAAASLSILGALQLGLEPSGFAVAAMVMSGVWIVIAVRMRGRYLDVFREQLARAGEVHDEDFPDVDVTSLQALIDALSNPDDRKVCATLDLLAAEGKSHMIPALVLYHPSEEVVLRALDAFALDGRTDFLAHAHRMARESTPAIRAAVVAATARAEGDTDRLREALESDEPGVRASASIYMFQYGNCDDDQAHQAVQNALNSEPGVLVVLARTIGNARAAEFCGELLELFDVEEPRVRRAVIDSSAQLGGRRIAEALRNLLGDRESRNSVRAALVRVGKPAFEVLVEGLQQRTLHKSIRWQIPAALCAFGPDAADPMLRVMADEPDGMVRYRIVRELEGLQMEEKLELDPEKVRRSLDHTLRRAWQYLQWEDCVRTARDSHPETNTSTQGLLLRMLRDKREHIVGTAMRLLSLTHESADFASIRRGLDSGREDIAAIAHELLQHVLDDDVKDAVLGLLDDDWEGEPLFHFDDLTYVDLMGRLLSGESEILAALAIRHVGEVGMEKHRDAICSMLDSATVEFTIVIENALGLLDDVSKKRQEWQEASA